jgi:hypothetical protein
MPQAKTALNAGLHQMKCTARFTGVKFLSLSITDEGKKERNIERRDRRVRKKKE